MNDIYQSIKQSVTADVFRTMNSPAAQSKIVEQFKIMPDEQLDVLGKHAGISNKHLSIYRDLVRGCNNVFNTRLNYYEETLLPGDVILVMGKAITSKALLSIQKRSYSRARSSHVIIAQADYICVDAVPQIGVSPRIIPELLSDVEANWQVIRFNGLTSADHEKIMMSSAYYLEQPYRILPSKKPAKNYSYCSELARKIYLDSDIKKTGIPQTSLIKPCDFDRIADENKNWTDITSRVKPYIDFCIEFTDIIGFIAKPYIQGIDLNRQRYKEREETKHNIKILLKNGKISKEFAKKALSDIEQAEKNMNFKFWDFNKS